MMAVPHQPGADQLVEIGLSDSSRDRRHTTFDVELCRYSVAAHIHVSIDEAVHGETRPSA